MSILTRKRIDEGWRYYQQFVEEQQRKAGKMAKKKGSELRMGESYDKRTFGFVYEALLNDAGIDVNRSTWEERKEIIRKAAYRSIGHVFESEDGTERYVSPDQARALHTAAEAMGLNVRTAEFIYGTDDAIAVIDEVRNKYRELRESGVSGKNANAIIASMFFGSP